MEKYFYNLKTWLDPLDPLLVVGNESHITYIGFIDTDDKKEDLLLKEKEGFLHQSVTPPIEKTLVQLGEYFKGQRKNFSLSLEKTGTAFQQKVWTCLTTIPYGTTWSYEKLAKEAGSPKGYRAAGNANGKNPFSIVVPCHRVIAKNGGLGGYGGGLKNKAFLLALEEKHK